MANKTLFACKADLEYTVGLLCKGLIPGNPTQLVFLFPPESVDGETGYAMCVLTRFLTSPLPSVYRV